MINLVGGLSISQKTGRARRVVLAGSDSINREWKKKREQVMLSASPGGVGRIACFFFRRFE